jgi:hypothetical protein
MFGRKRKPEDFSQELRAHQALEGRSRRHHRSHASLAQ